MNVLIAIILLKGLVFSFTSVYYWLGNKLPLAIVSKHIVLLKVLYSHKYSTTINFSSTKQTIIYCFVIISLGRVGKARLHDECKEITKKLKPKKTKLFFSHLLS